MTWRVAKGAWCCQGRSIAKYPRSVHGLGLAIRVSGRALMPRRALWHAVPVSPARERGAAGGDEGGPGCGLDEAGRLPHVSAFVRDAPARGRLRHPDRAGAARSRGRDHDDDLHARAEPGRDGRAEPGRSALIGSSLNGSCGHSQSISSLHCSVRLQNRRSFRELTAFVERPFAPQRGGLSQSNSNAAAYRGKLEVVAAVVTSRRYWGCPTSTGHVASLIGCVLACRSTPRTVMQSKLGRNRNDG